MRWQGAVALAVGLLWGSVGWASNEFGAANGRYYPLPRYCPEEPVPPEPCPPSLSALCEAGKYAAEVTDPRIFRIQLADALRLRGLPGRAQEIHVPTWSTSDDGMPFRTINPLFEDVARSIYAGTMRAIHCQPEEARKKLSEALAYATHLKSPARIGAMAQVAYHQVRLGFRDDANVTFSQIMDLPLPATDTAFVPIEGGKPAPRWTTPDVLTVFRPLAVAAAALGHFDLAMAKRPTGSLSVDHLIAQLAVQQGRADVALALAPSEGRWRGAVYQTLIDAGHLDHVRAIVDARPDSEREDFEQVALAWAVRDPQAAVAYVRNHDPHYIASALITCAALVGNTRGALVLLRGASGITAFRKRHLRGDDPIEAAREEVDFAAAIGYTALAVADHGRRRDALRLLAEAEPLFEGIDFHSRIGWPTGIIALSYAYLGEVARGVKAIERTHRVRGETPKEKGEQRRWHASALDNMVGAHAYALAHRGSLDEAMGLLSRYPSNRDAILTHFVVGATERAQDPLSLSYHMESRYEWWQIMANVEKTAKLDTFRYPWNE